MIGDILGTGASALGGYLGASAAKKGGKKLVKGEKKALATNQQALDWQKANQQASVAAANAATPQQVNALTGAYNQQIGFQQPYMGIGTEATGGLGGYSGRDPAAAAAMEQAFQNSPLYKLNYDAMMQQGQRAIDRSLAARGMSNSGDWIMNSALLGPQVLNSLFSNNYVPQLNSMLQYGQGAANQATNAAGNYGQNVAGAYGQQASNLINANQIGGQQVGSAYGNVANNQIGLGQAQAAKAMGPQAAWAGALGNVANIWGNQSYAQPQQQGNGAPGWQNMLSAIPGNYS